MKMKNISNGFNFDDDTLSFVFDKIQDFIDNNPIEIEVVKYDFKHEKLYPSDEAYPEELDVEFKFIDDLNININFKDIGLTKENIDALKEYINEDQEGLFSFSVNCIESEFKPSTLEFNDDSINIKVNIDDINKETLDEIIENFNNSNNDFEF